MNKFLHTLVLLICLPAAAWAGGASEATIDEYGNVVTDDDDEDGVDPTIPHNEELTITITNLSPYRADVYYEDGEYGVLIATLEGGESTGINSFVGHTFYATRHGKIFFII